MKCYWKKEETNYFKREYPYKKNKELAKELKKSRSSIMNKAHELKLKKDKEFYCKSRRHLPFEIDETMLKEMYIIKKMSFRRISKELKVGKTTIEYYLKKYKIKIRNKSEANKERFKWDNTWAKGKSKDTDIRILKASKKLRKKWNERKLMKIREIEIKFKTPFPELLNQLYWEEGLSLEKIGKKLRFDRERLSKLFKRYNISLRPKFQHISSLKGKNHPHFGKSWEQFFGKEKAKKYKIKMSKIARKSIIKRLKNNNFPFLDTKIELILNKEMIKRKIPFIKQFNIDDKFVCDFAIPSSKLIIECDGDYWHANPSIYHGKNLTIRQKVNLNRDYIKDKYLNNKGWKVLRFFELDIKKSPINCVDEIEKHIKHRLRH